MILHRKNKNKHTTLTKNVLIRQSHVEPTVQTIRIRNLSILQNNLDTIIKYTLLHVIESYITKDSLNNHSHSKLGHHNEGLPDP